MCVYDDIFISMQQLQFAIAQFQVQLGSRQSSSSDASLSFSFPAIYNIIHIYINRAHLQHSSKESAGRRETGRELNGYVSDASFWWIWYARIGPLRILTRQRQAIGIFYLVGAEKKADMKGLAETRLSIGLPLTCLLSKSETGNNIKH